MSVFRHYCRGCGTFKPEGEFYVSSPTKCKECVKEKVNAYRAANLAKVQEYDRGRGMLPHRVALRCAYSKTEAYAESHAASATKWDEKYPDRRDASTAVGNAVRDGRLLKWPACAIPDCNSKPHAHHPDYSKPLSVVWLCPIHHKQAHAIARKVA